MLKRGDTSCKSAIKVPSLLFVCLIKGKVQHWLFNTGL